jgi:hypothetical protein
MRMQGNRTGGSIALCAAVALMALATNAVSQGPGGQPADPTIVKVVAGDALIVEQTTNLKSLKIEEGAQVAAPAGKSLTMTINGVEQDIKPGQYKGEIVLTPADQHVVKFSESMIHHFRQAIYMDKTGMVDAKSVLAAAGKPTVKDGVLTGANIKSEGRNFNGILVTGGSWTIKDAKLDFEGNGDNDFAGFGAGIMSDGKGTTLILDGAKVSTHGAVRTTVIANNGSNLIVKNSEISSVTGVLPSDYISNVTPGEMKDAPWMLGISGNVRATNLLGDNTTATYINSKLASDGWGVLSIDSSQNTFLTTINGQVDLTGKDGYGSYSIGNATNQFYGTTMNVPTHGLIITGGHGYFGASTPEQVAKLNADLKLQLSPEELASIKTQQTTVNSKRFGLMIWGDSEVKVTDGTVFNTGENFILNKAAQMNLTVDGSKGAQLNAKNGVLFQAIDSDDPGPVTVDGVMVNRGVYTDPTSAPDKVKDWDLAAKHKDDMVGVFSNIDLKGDFYNAVSKVQSMGPMAGMGGPGGGDAAGGAGAPGGAPGGDAAGGPGGAAPGGAAAGGPGGPGGGAPSASGKNLVLTFEKSKIAGVITASQAKHKQNPIDYKSYEMLGEVTNTPGPAINNGVVVTLTGSTWTVTGNSYLTGLTLDKTSSVVAPAGQKVTMTVDGKVKAIKRGIYKGAIVVQVVPGA